MYDLLNRILKKHGITVKKDIKEIIAPFFKFLKCYQDSSLLFSPIESKVFLKMFDLLGIDLKDNLADYKNVQIIKDIFGDSELDADYKNILSSEIKERLNTCPSIQDAILKLKQNGIQDENCLVADLYDIVFNSTGDCGYVQLVPTYDGYKFICVCKNALTLTNHVLLHELNHICEMDILEENDNEIIYKTGFATLNFNKKISKLDYDTVAYYLQNLNEEDFVSDPEIQHNISLNEVINDYITISIDKIFEHNGINFSLNDNQTITSCYKPGFPLLKNYIDKNLEALKTYRMVADPKAYRKLIGKNNYDNLAKCTNQLLSLGSYPLAKMYNNLFFEAGYIKPKDISKCIWSIIHKGVNWSSE